jgi:MFS family permease
MATALRSPLIDLGRRRLQTFAALRHRNYRLYWFGMLVAIIGFQIQTVAVGWLVYQLTNSPAMLGAVSLMQAIPAIGLTLFGGVVADRMDRRRTLLVTQTTNGLLLLVLATLVATEMVQLWHIFAVAAGLGVVNAFDQPARLALVPHLVPREDLMNAIAMGSVIWQSARIVGPSIAGLLIATTGIASCFYVTTFGFLTMVAAVWAVRVPPVTPPADGRSALHNLREGVAYVVKTPIFSTLIGLTFFNSIFGMSYVSMMPVFARDLLDVGSRGYGFLMGVSGIGALLGTLIVASLGNTRHKGVLLLAGGAAFGSFVFLFAISRVYPVSLGLIFFMGAVNSIYMTTVNTLLQALVPDELRGRVMSIYTLTYSLVPFGAFLAGGIAGTFPDAATGASIAVALGGLMVTLAAAFVAAFVPRVRRVDAAPARA